MLITEVFGTLVLMLISALIVALVWNDLIDKHRLSVWSVYFRTLACSGLMMLFIRLVAQPLGLGGW